MLTPPPDVSEDDLVAAIERGWGIAVDSIHYRPIGFGSHHWVATDMRGVPRFVTVDELSTESRIGDEVSALGFRLRAALSSAVDMRNLGCTFVVAPITTTADEPLVQFGTYSLALFPFVEGRSFSSEESFGRTDREQVLEMVVALHRVPRTAIRPPPADEFTVPWLDELDRAQEVDGRTGPHADRASQLMVESESRIRREIARYQTFVARYVSDPVSFVVTHGEIHPGNLMMTAEGWVLVDWDTALLAPPERDLWRLAQGDGSVLRAYESVTGTAPSQSLVDLYELRWDLAEIASFAAKLRRPHEDTEDSRMALDLLGAVVARLRP